MQGRVEEGKLLIGRWLEYLAIALHVLLGDREPAVDVTIDDATDQLVVGHVKKPELHRDAELSSNLQPPVAFGSSPEPPLEDDRCSQRQQSSREFQELRFEPNLEGFVEWIDTKRDLPFVGIQPNGAV